MSTVKAMRRDWDERARKNAFHYIASWREEWDSKSFLDSGEEDYQRLVSPVLNRCGVSSSGDVMVELGCGVGRMTPNFARRYRRVLALDLSVEMLDRARNIHAKEKNILWLCVNGTDLTCLASGSADFIFSYLVLQHLPIAELTVGYVREMLRVLRPGGAFLFQFNSSRKPTMNRKGRIAWSIVDALWSAGLVPLSHLAASHFGLDYSVAGKSWRGAAIEATEIGRTVQSNHGEIHEMSGVDTPMTWCCGAKKANV